jgi:hypothetical protein
MLHPHILLHHVMTFDPARHDAQEIMKRHWAGFLHGPEPIEHAPAQAASPALSASGDPIVKAA